MKNLTKNFAIVLSLLMLFGTFVPQQTSAASQPVATVFTPGTYTGTGYGHNGRIVVETTVDASKILSVKIVEQFESPGVQPVINVVPEAIVAQQSLGVDTVAGATFCGLGVIAAAKDCLTQAGGNIDKLSEKKTKAPDADQTYEVDVIVVGAGGAGLSAAVSAHQNGSSVIVVEKLGLAGGSTAFSGGAYNAADPEGEAAIEMTASNEKAIQDLINKKPNDDFEATLQAKVKAQFEEHKKKGGNGLFDSTEFHVLQTYNGGDYAGRPELITTLAEKAMDTLAWMTSIGAKWNPKLGSATGSLWQRSHYGTEDFPDGMHSVTPYKAYIDKNDNVEIHFNTKANELIMENGRVVGVKATRNGGTMTYKAKRGVVMATGGFGANVEMRQKYNEQWDNLDSSIGCSNQRPAAQGDGIVMGEKVGAQLIDMGLIQLHPNGEEFTGNMMGRPGTSGLNRIFVNNDGNRFMAEDSRRDDQVRAIYKQPGGTMWIIADSTRFPANGNKDDVQINNEVSLGKTFKADTVEDLAKQIGVDAVNLQKAIDEYNAIVDGTPDPLGLKTYDKKLGNAPYYAAKRLPTVHHTMGGLKIDTNARVLGKDDKPIPGFYAAGEVTGGIHGANRLGGNAIVDINVFGKIAGESVSAGEKVLATK